MWIGTSLLLENLEFANSIRCTMQLIWNQSTAAGNDTVTNRNGSAEKMKTKLKLWRKWIKAIRRERKCNPAL